MFFIVTDEPDESIPDKFIVPYLRNPRFTGRETFLNDLKTRLNEQVEQGFSHRVALYGLGGIGKTQIALEYVYRNETSYERIYWISAASQAALLADYQKIAENVNIKILPQWSAVDIAEAMKRWLGSKH